MTAQISPNRMEVSDRFPMLGFAVRTSQPDVEAEVVIATDIGLFSAQNRQMRNAANFYTSREHGTLRVPRGDGVFVVPPEVLARFIGNEKLYFGLATGSGGAGGLQVDALPREGSPYVSLRGFTGRTLRRGFGALRPTAPKLDWAGDQPRPGSEPAPAASAPAPAAASPAEPVPYDDGFGPMPEIPARESAYRAPRQPVVPAGQGDVALSLGTGTTAQAALAWIRRKIEQGVSAAGSEVEPPSMLYLGAASGTFRTAWQAGLGITGLINPFNAFLAAIPTLARETGVTLSIGPALDTPLFGAGIGVVFAPDGQVALFGQGEISLDFDGLSEFVRSLKLALAARMKLGYNRGGLAAFADISTVAGIIVGEEIVGGAEIWLDSRGSGIGGAVSIGVGFALQLAEEESAYRAPRQPVVPAGQGDVALSLGTGTTAQAALAWIRRKIEQGVSAAGSEVEPPSMLYLGAASGTFRTAWQAGLGITGLINPFNAFLAAIPTLARETGVTLSIGPALDTPLFGAGIGVVFAPDGQVALFGQGEISLDFDGLSEFVRSLKLALAARMKLGYNRGGLAAFADISTVAGIIVGEETVGGAEIWLDSRGSGIGGAVSIGVGFALQLAEEESAKGAIVRPVMPGDARARATRIGGEFAPQIHRALDSGLEEAALQRLLDTLDPPTTATPLSAMAALPEAVRPAQKLPAGALSGGGANAAEIVQAGVAVVGLVEKWGEGDISYQVDKFEGWHRPQQAEGQPLRTVDRASAVVEWDDGGFLDAIGLKLRIAWDHDGWSVGNVLITPFGFNDAVGDALFVRAEIVKTGQPFNGITTPFTRSGAGGAPASPADYAGNPGAMLEIIVTYRRGRMVRNDVTEGRRILLLPTGQYVEMVMALD